MKQAKNPVKVNFDARKIMVSRSFAVRAANPNSKEYCILTDIQKENIHNIVSEMIEKESEFLVYKKNANEMQENVKFPDEYRERLNKLLIEILGVEFDIKELDKVHQNSLF